MKKDTLHFLFTLLFVFAFFISCSSEEGSDDVGTMTEGLDDDQEQGENDEGDSQSNATPYLTINVAENLPTSGSDNWILVHNSQGELLDFKSYESGENLIFETEANNVTDELNITLFDYTVEFASTNHTIGTYTKIPKGSVWNFKPNRSQPNLNDLTGDIVGSMTLNLTNVIGPFIVQFSNEFRALGGNTTQSVIPVDISNSITLYENTNEHLISIIDGNGELRYKTVSGLQVDDEITIDYSEFLLFDDILEVEIPDNGEYFAAVYGFEEGQELRVSPGNAGFLHNLIFPIYNEYVVADPLPLGYLNRFENFLTHFYFENDTFFYSYKKYGEKSEGITIPQNPTLTLENEAISEFAFSTNQEFDRVLNLWQTSQGERNVDFIRTDWAVHSSDNSSVVIGSFPQEILGNYPDMDLENLEYTTTRLYISGESYSEMITNRFISQEPYNLYFSEEEIAFFKE